MSVAAADRPAALARSRPAPPQVAIVGGGASGVLLAAQLMRQGQGAVEVQLVEKGEMLGCGVAYGTRDPAHLLNTRVANMSAFAAEPGHFLDWLRREEPGLAEPQGFVSRSIYGRYLGTLLDDRAGGAAAECRRGEAVAAVEEADGVLLRLGDGSTLRADRAVLATGHSLPEAASDPCLSQPWSTEPASPLASIVIVGSGLTMVDQVLSLLAAGHRGPITALSRRGLLPQVHAPGEPVAWMAGEVPIGAGPAALMRWLRAQARARVAAGGAWQGAVDGLRPHLQAAWAAMPSPARRSFLRHAATLWEVHRHRMPPASRRTLDAARDAGQLVIVRGRFEGAARNPGGGLVAHIRRPDGALLALPADRIVDARGIRRDPEAHATPLVADLLARGAARIDPLRIGLDVAPDGAVVDREGRASRRLFAMGPASRAAFWEITAIPDIRAQAARLAERLLAGP